MSPEQVAGVEALAAIIEGVGLDDMEGGDAFAMAERLSEAGWQLTRVGDEERLRAAVNWTHRFHAFGPEYCTPANCSVAQFLAGGVRADDPSLAWNAAAPQPPSPASQGEGR